MHHAPDSGVGEPHLAFKLIYDEHFAFVWRTLRQFHVPEASLKDAVQDVFLVVHRRLHAFGGRAKVSTWLFGICIRVARDYRRRAHVRHEVLDDSDFGTIVDPRSDAAAAVESHEDLRRLQSALDENQLAVFILFELEDMTGEEIAESLCIPLGTVYSRLRLARAAFKKRAAATAWLPQPRFECQAV